VTKSLSFEYRSYSRPFKTVIKTAKGSWEKREGIIIRLSDKNQYQGFGEIAPVPEFGTETQARALDFCRNLESTINKEVIGAIPAELPCSDFAFNAALERLQKSGKTSTQKSLFANTMLLPGGREALPILVQSLAEGYHTFKWKIGMEDITYEQECFRELAQNAPKTTSFRLDANGALTVDDAVSWLKLLEHQPVDFLEQPLPHSQIDSLFSLSQNFKVPIALDESITHLETLKAFQSRRWKGIFIIKPAIMGSLKKLQNALAEIETSRIILSSVFETAVGVQTGLDFAATMNLECPLGYGTLSCFSPKDGLSLHRNSPQLDLRQVTEKDFECLWQRLSERSQTQGIYSN